jgi:hypothetical protein
MKFCSTCKIEKELSEFNKDSSRASGYRYDCRPCAKIKYVKNTDKRQIHYQNNKQKLNEKSRIYQQKNKEKLKIKRQIFYENNKTNICMKNMEYEKLQKKLNPLYKLKKDLRKLITMSITRQGYSKNSKTHELLGQDFHNVRQYLIATAISNYGFYDENLQYHIDHIIPCSAAKTEAELVKLQHYTNLQYLYPKDNLSKGNKKDWILNKTKDKANGKSKS